MPDNIGAGNRPFGSIAQLGAHLTGSQGVRGSSPLGSTNFKGFRVNIPRALLSGVSTSTFVR